jgi:hypothetical protein
MKAKEEKSGVPKVVGADPDFRRVDDKIVCPGCDLHFKSSSPSLAMTCPRCKLRGFQFPDNVPICEGCGTRGLCFVVDDVHWKMWVPFPPEIMEKLREAAGPDKIVVAWKTIMGVTLNRDTVACQLGDRTLALSEPQNKASRHVGVATPATNNKSMSERTVPAGPNSRKSTSK